MYLQYTYVGHVFIRLFDVYTTDFNHVGSQWPGLGQTVVSVDKNEGCAPMRYVGHGRRIRTEVSGDQFSGRVVGECMKADRAEDGGHYVDQPLEERHVIAGECEQVVDQVRGILWVGHAVVELRRVVRCADEHERRVEYVGKHGKTFGGECLHEHYVERTAVTDQRPDAGMFECQFTHPVVHLA